MDGESGVGASPDEEWPPPEARVRAALWQAEGHLLRAEWAHAGTTLSEALPLAHDPDIVRGLRHLAAAGFKAREGDRARAHRRLAEARRRLAPFPAVYEEVDLVALVESVASAVRDAT